MENTKVELKDTELEAVTGGTEPVEWSIPEGGLPRPSRDTEPENNTSEWIPNTTEWTPNTNEGWGSEIETPKPGTYELHGVVWGQD